MSLRRMTATVAAICSNCGKTITTGSTAWTRGPIRICAACERKC